jgi:PBSX family phage terminase large subunit
LVVKEIRYKPLGAARDLFLIAMNAQKTGESPEFELVLEGPAGTGKTRCALEYIDWCCDTYPGIRVLMVRKTRHSMSETVLVTLEEKVFYENHPAVIGDARRNNRQFYEYPNKSHIVVGGMDNSDRIMSSEYDLCVVFEATEISLEDWEKLISRMRNNVMPFQQMIADCNPASQYHWINQRANAGKMKRLLSRHKDNPSLTENYLAALGRLTGARYERLFKGLWVTEEGLIYDEWDPAVHLVLPKDVPEMKWHFASVDWGFRAPGVCQVWGVDGNNRLYLVSETYRVEKNTDWWAGTIEDLHEKYNLKVIVCDPAEPDSIDLLNQRLGYLGGRESKTQAIKANNAWQAGSDLLRWGLEPGMDGSARLYIVADNLHGGRDPKLAERMAPCAFQEEIVGYVWMKQVDGKVIKDAEDPSCPNHSMDAARYACMYAWGSDLSDPQAKVRYKPNTFGGVLGHEEIEDAWAYHGSYQ